MNKNDLIIRPVKQFEGCYEISSCGKVFSVDRTISDYNNGAFREYVIKGREIKSSKSGSKKAYLSVKLNKKGKYYHRYIHRIVAEAFVENKNDLPCVNHIDGNSFNNVYSNLEWRSYSGNATHARDIGRIKHTKLSYNQVCQIRTMITLGSSQSSVARHFNISQAHARNIYIGKKWKDIL